MDEVGEREADAPHVGGADEDHRHQAVGGRLDEHDDPLVPREEPGRRGRASGVRREAPGRARNASPPISPSTGEWTRWYMAGLR